MTPAQQLLSLVFEGHTIRTALIGDKPFFVAKDVATACGLSKYRDAIKTHLDPDEGCPVEMDTPGGKQAMLCVTEAGLAALVMSSRKPAARMFRRWLLDEVLPQLLKYGTYAPGATAGERCAALHTRWKHERARELGFSATAYEASGLLTIAAFRRLEPNPGEDALLLCHHLRAIARERGLAPERFFTGSRRHTPAWPLEMLQAARRRGDATFVLRLPR